MIDAMFYNHFQIKKSLQLLLLVVISLSLLSPILSFLIFKYFQLPGPIFWLSLSSYGFKQGLYYQLLTYPLIARLSTSFDISLLATVSIHAYLLWFTSHELMYRFSTKAFWWVFVSSILICGLAGLTAVYFFVPDNFVYGLTPILFALGALYVLCYPEMNLFLLGAIKIKVKWLALILFAVSLLSALSANQIALFCSEIAGLIWGYLIGRWILKIPVVSSSRFT